ncbi:kinase-associated lipoprotein B [Bacillus sp. B1-b2]|uniref:kinase-associated lipoprotein B n=1 Tax=Bacillus sp. B1-b2 TaxID=2653201 RepID=UPI0012620B9E|nr:kinase-associated lipoprotein B [Bacillus sp. B1-b2]KAB7666464.1 kinase [Bacillus sp. B1-b2]
MSELTVGSIVTAFYKTGKYIGEITEIRAQSYLVRVFAVLKHPIQGDLHHPKETSVGIFHERKALSYREQMNAPKSMVKLYQEEQIPSYQDSLANALYKLEQELSKENTDYSSMSLTNLDILKKEYYRFLGIKKDDTLLDRQ